MSVCPYPSRIDREPAQGNVSLRVGWIVADERFQLLHRFFRLVFARINIGQLRADVSLQKGRIRIFPKQLQVLSLGVGAEELGLVTWWAIQDRVLKGRWRR